MHGVCSNHVTYYARRTMMMTLTMTPMTLLSRSEFGELAADPSGRTPRQLLVTTAAVLVTIRLPRAAGWGSRRGGRFTRCQLPFCSGPSGRPAAAAVG